MKRQKKRQILQNIVWIFTHYLNYHAFMAILSRNFLCTTNSWNALLVLIEGCLYTICWHIFHLKYIETSGEAANWTIHVESNIIINYIFSCYYSIDEWSSSMKTILELFYELSKLCSLIWNVTCALLFAVKDSFTEI